MDRNPYKNLIPYPEIFHEYPAQYTHRTNSNAAPSQVSHEIIPTQPLCNSRRSLHIHTDASKTNDRCLIAFYLPHNPEIQGQFNIPKMTSVYMAELSAI